MRKIFLLLILMSSIVFADDTQDILNEIKVLRVDIPFNILSILMGLIFISLFISIYLRDKRKLKERKKLFDSIKAILFVFREQAQDDEKLSRSLKAAGLM